MSATYLLVKATTGSAYELGSPIFYGFSTLHEMRDNYPFNGPADKAIWKIGSDSTNCEVHDFSKRWTVDALAKLIVKAILEPNDIDKARLIAQDILEWAGSEPVVLLPDSLEFEEIAARYPPKKIRIMKSVYRR